MGLSSIVLAPFIDCWLPPSPGSAPPSAIVQASSFSILIVTGEAHTNAKSRASIRTDYCYYATRPR